ncbi:DUF3360 family protein [Vibrio lentus]|nr:DUF3360 family protein [Vibrio lentus]
MDVDDTMTMCSVRQNGGTRCGGGNITSSWGTYMIPAANREASNSWRRNLAWFCIIVVILGFPMDVAVWPPQCVLKATCRCISTST